MLDNIQFYNRTIPVYYTDNRSLYKKLLIKWWCDDIEYSTDYYNTMGNVLINTSTNIYPIDIKIVKLEIYPKCIEICIHKKIITDDSMIFNKLEYMYDHLNKNSGFCIRKLKIQSLNLC